MSSVRSEIPVVETPDSQGHGTVLSHPAFGQISVSRIRGGPSALYGSDILHRDQIEIAIRRSELHRNLSQDWCFPRDEVIAVRMSEAQFAAFVSSVNVGSGVPCTLTRLNGQFLPTIPYRPQQERFEQEVHGYVRKAVERVDKAIEEIMGELGASLSQKKREAILGSLRRLRKDLDDALPFVLQQFAEHMENTVEHAKGEVNAYIMTMIQRAGLSALAESHAAEDAPLQLGTGDAPTEGGESET